MTPDSSNELYTIELKNIDGQPTNLEPYKEQILLIVNVASRCGFTPQYSQLEELYNEFKEKGFSILAFPCNQFRQQEPGSNEEIKTAAKQCFRVSFPFFAKVDVKGQNQAPLYRYLAKNIKKKPWFFIPWNFSKILVDSQGRVLKQYLPFSSFKKIRRDIQKLLSQSAGQG